MIYFLAVILLGLLFFLLGKTADQVVDAVGRFCTLARVKVFFVGIILGLVTSLPEFSIALNSLVNNVPEVSLGNLMGSLMVVLGLVFGVSIILNRSIKTDGKSHRIVPLLGYLFLPIVFALDGTISRLDSALLILWYVWILYYLYSTHQAGRERKARPTTMSQKEFLFELFVMGLGMVSLLLLSNLIVQISEILLVHFNISGFFAGLVVFAIGTNLPEITVMLRSWKRNMKELSMSHLMGSVIVDPLLIGIFGFISPFVVARSLGFVHLMLFALLLLVSFYLFYRSGKRFSRTEGFLLVTIYLLFLIGEVSISILTRG